MNDESKKYVVACWLCDSKEEAIQAAENIRYYGANELDIVEVEIKQRIPLTPQKIMGDK